MPRTPTLEDVATAAGVSTATVSRCLNAPEMVAKATRARVEAAVEALGYAPNFSARALVARRTRTIGAVIPTMANAVFAEGIQAFQDVLQSEGFMLLIASSGYDPEAEAEALRTLAARGADGILLIGFDRSPAVYDFLATQGIPAVVAWAHDPAGPVPSVGFDNAAAMRDLVAHAIGLGHRNVGIVAGIQAGNDRARARVDGAQAALRAAGLDAAPIVESDYDFAAGGAALDRLLAAHPEITLVICGNDVIAAGVIRHAAALGMSVPRDLSVTGFDDIGLAQVVDPPLTTVRVPHRVMGQAAAERLLTMLEGQPAASEAFGTELCLRASLAPPRAAH